MPKETFIARFSLIIKRLEKGPATYEQIAKYLEDESAIQDRDFIISRRTLQRDIRDIYSQLNIEISNEKRGDKRYFIKTQPETQEHSQRLLESYQIVNAIHAAHDFSEYVFLETRKPKGLEHFYGLLYSIRNKRVLHFTYFKYPDEDFTNRIVHPLGLKESQGRWYLIGIDAKDKKLKTFGLDRMKDIDISKSKFRESYDYNLNALFSHSFGIINTGKEKLQTLLLKFSYNQAQYIKTYPLHASQKVIEENRNGLLIEIVVFITYDLIKELISFGEDLVVMNPLKLRGEIKKTLTNTLKLYK
jgi:predicted DNA-binding transcriptional regulator YafY